MQRSVAYALVTMSKSNECLSDRTKLALPQHAEIEERPEAGAHVTIARNTTNGKVGVIKRHASGLIEAQLIDARSGQR